MPPIDASARAARETFERLLVAELPAVAGSLPAGYPGLAERYVALLLDANARVNLTRVVEPDAIARLHLLDSVAALPLLDELAPTRVVEIGAGGGVPGLLLAAARPDVRWTLVDSVGRKVEAVRGFAGALGLANVEVRAERAEIMGHDDRHREACDVVTARACAALPVLAEYGLPLLRIGGALLAWKGPIAEDELRAGSIAAQILGGGRPEVRPSGAASLGMHRFVLVVKERLTPSKYPRRPGQPSRRPLG